MYLFLAALHALPSFIGAWLFEEKGWTYGSIFAVICAIIFGSSDFIIFDLLGVGAGALLGHLILDNRKLENKKAPDIKKQVIENVEELSRSSKETAKNLFKVDEEEPTVLDRGEQIGRILGFILVLVCLYAWFTN